MTSVKHLEQPVLIELGDDAWKSYLDSVESWLDNTLLAQSAFRHLAEDIVNKIHDPRVKEQLICIADSAKEHEQKTEELYRVIGRQPSGSRKIAGEVMSRARQALGGLLGMAGGADTGWSDMRQLMLANLNAIGAFGAVQQVGLVLGLSELATRAFEIVRDKSTEQLVLQEYMLELAPQAILYQLPDANQFQGTEMMSKHSSYPGKEPEGTQPRVEQKGIPADPVVGTTMEKNADQQQ